MKNIVLLTALAACALSANASEYFVATNGCDEADGSASRPYCTIQRAADVAMAGNVLWANKRDLFFEVDHGSILVEGNTCLPPKAAMTCSQGIAYVPTD